jgi:hypothetical protein
VTDNAHTAALIRAACTQMTQIRIATHRLPWHLGIALPLLLCSTTTHHSLPVPFDAHALMVFALVYRAGTRGVFFRCNLGFTCNHLPPLVEWADMDRLFAIVVPAVFLLGFLLCRASLSERISQRNAGIARPRGQCREKQEGTGKARAWLTCTPSATWSWNKVVVITRGYEQNSA